MPTHESLKKSCKDYYDYSVSLLKGTPVGDIAVRALERLAHLCSLQAQLYEEDITSLRGQANDLAARCYALAEENIKLKEREYLTPSNTVLASIVCDRHAINVDKTAAINLIRKITGLSLVDSKAICDRGGTRYPIRVRKDWRGCRADVTVHHAVNVTESSH